MTEESYKDKVHASKLQKTKEKFIIIYDFKNRCDAYLGRIGGR